MLHDEVAVKLEDGRIKVDPRNETKRARAQWGTSRTLVANLVTGVTKGFEQKLEINGVGYRAAVQGKNLQLALGFSHDVVYPIPDGITIATPRPIEIVISGIDKQKVGQVAAEIREFRPPEPYKGKGVKYADETSSARKARRSNGAADDQSRQKDRTAEGAHTRGAARGGVRPQRLSVFRSSKHIYAQVIDDESGADRRRRLLDREADARQRSRPAPTSTRPRRSASWSPSGPLDKGVKEVMFDRGGYIYHGRVKALADAAREGGLKF